MEGMLCGSGGTGRAAPCTPAAVRRPGLHAADLRVHARQRPVRHHRRLRLPGYRRSRTSRARTSTATSARARSGRAVAAVGHLVFDARFPSGAEPDDLRRGHPRRALRRDPGRPRTRSCPCRRSRRRSTRSPRRRARPRGGEVVLITGANFSGATNVLFGMLPSSSVTVQSSTALLAVAPPRRRGNGGRLRRRTPECRAGGEAAGAFTYCPIPRVPPLRADAARRHPAVAARGRGRSDAAAPPPDEKRRAPRATVRRTP